MALITCPECGKEISDSAEKCIHCGYPLKAKAESKPAAGNKANKLVIVLAILLLIAIGAIVGILATKGEKKETCKAEGCSKEVYSSGLCITHYGEQRNGEEVKKESETTVASSETKGETEVSEPIEEDVEVVIPFNKDSTVKTESCEFTLKGYTIATKIEPKNCTSTYYHYYEASNGNVYVDATFKIKNLGKSAVSQDKVVKSVKVFYDGDYEYRCSLITVDKDGDFEGYTSLYSINALETMDYHMLAELPIEAKGSSKPLKIQVVVDGSTYECNLR